jgi:hypothetical protein
MFNDIQDVQHGKYTIKNYEHNNVMWKEQLSLHFQVQMCVHAINWWY